MEIYLFVALACVSIALSVAILVKMGARRQPDSVEAAVKSLEKTLLQNIDRVSAAGAEQSAALRQEILGQFGELSKMQAGMLEGLSKSNERVLLQLRASVEEKLAAIQQVTDEKLASMQKTVDEKLSQSLKTGIESSFKRVSEQLSELYKSMGEVRTLTSGVGDLTRILSNVKNRGTWGEVQLSKLLEDVMAPSQYMVNAQIGRETVEYAIVLPGEDKRVLLPIDSKFPMDRYARVQETKDGENAAAKKELTRAILDEAKKINAKYVSPPKTTDFAIMFLPSEGLYAEAIQLGVTQEAQRRYRVLVTGPSTLSALLTSLQVGFKTLAISQRSAKIQEALAMVHNEFIKFEDYIEKTRKSLNAAQNHLDVVSRKSTRIISKLDVAELAEPAAEALLPSAEPD